MTNYEKPNMDLKEYLKNKEDIYKECGIKPRNKNINCHHVYFKNDKHLGLLPNNFKIHDRSNLVPLDIQIHNQLHWMIDNLIGMKRDITNRVYMANMAYNEELDLFPDRFYRKRPRD